MRNRAFQIAKLLHHETVQHAAPPDVKEDAAIKRSIETRHQALVLFASKGYSNVGIRQLASALGINCGSIYNHIESKEALLCEFFEELFEVLHQHATRILRREPASERLRALIEMHVRLQARMPEHFLLVERERYQLSDPWLEQADAQRLRYEQLIARMLGLAAKDQGCASSIVTLLNLAHNWLAGCTRTFDERVEILHNTIRLMLGYAVQTGASMAPCAKSLGRMEGTLSQT